MTASRARRQRNTWLALGTTVVVLVIAVALSGVGVVSLSNSTAGRNVADDLELADDVHRLPWTATALIGVIDGDGVLTSTLVGVLAPGEHGGTLVSISPSADMASGSAEVIRPLVSIFAVDGPEGWRAAVEQLTGISFDVAEVINQERFDELIAPIGDMPTSLPYAFADANSGEVFSAGDTILSVEAAGQVVTSRNGDGPSWQLDAARDAVWAAVADAVGDGIGSFPEGASYDRTRPPGLLADFANALFDAPVDFRTLTTYHVDAGRVAEQMPLADAAVLGPDAADAVVRLDPSEIALVFGSIAPSRKGAPLDGPTVRLVSGFVDDDVAELELNRSDVMIGAIDVLASSQANVVSVVDQPGAEVPTRTRITVADPADVDAVWATYDGMFGDLQVRVAEVRIDGVDLVIELGRGFLDVIVDGSGVQGSGS